MPLDTPQPPPLDRSIVITDAFGELGRVNGMMMPRSKKKNERIAYEYWAASLLAQLAEARRGKAKKAAIAEGIIPDYTAKPLAIGAAETVYSGDVITIAVKVVAQADRVDVAALIVDLAKQGVPARTLARLVKRHTQTFNGAHILTATLVQ